MQASQRAELERFITEAAKSVEELASLRDRAQQDPKVVAPALSRALILIGSCTLWLRTIGEDLLSE